MPIISLTVEVASRAEAWIETDTPYLRPIATSVASRAEAWIETCVKYSAAEAGMSPTARRRGLKQGKTKIVRLAGFVASRAEAWIETNIAQYVLISH